MGAGQVAFDTWPISKLARLHLWVMREVLSKQESQIGIISNLDLEGIAEGIPLSSSDEPTEERIKLLTEFNDLVNSLIYTAHQLVPNFVFYFVLVRGDRSICWDEIKAIVDPAKHLPLSDADEMPDPPFLVTQQTSGIVYRVNCVLDISPGLFMHPVNQFGPQKGCGSQEIMTDFYRGKYGVTLNPDQPVLVGELGAPVHPDAPVDTPSLAQPKSKKPKIKSQVYLVPQLVKLHPLSGHLAALNRVPRTLFQIESGLIARRVARDLYVEKETEFKSYMKFFCPLNPSYFFNRWQLDLTATALTRPSAMLPVDYEHLEWLGDSVYRFVLAVMGLRDAQIRKDYFALMSNHNVGVSCLKHYPELCNAYILSDPPSLKNPERCRPRLTNLNILADVSEALVAVSFLVGGVDSTIHTLRKLGMDVVDPSSVGIVPPAANNLQAFIKSALRPAIIKLAASLQLIKNSDSVSMTIGQLDEARQLIITSVGKEDVASFGLYKRYCEPIILGI